MADSALPQPDPSARVDEFMRLYTQHQRRLYVYLLSLVHNVADAEELLQETSFILWKKFGTFQEPEKGTGPICRDGPEAGTDAERWSAHKLDLSPFPAPESNFGAWACRVAYLEVLKFREGRKQGELSLSPQFLERIAAKMAEVSDLLEYRGDAFNRCMDRLSEPDRELITRRYAPGASVRRLAAELNRPPHSVSKSLVRIRKTLLECIERHEREEERQ